MYNPTIVMPMTRYLYLSTFRKHILGIFIFPCFLGLFIGVSTAGALEQQCVTIQLGSFADPHNAERYKEHMKNLVPYDLTEDLRIVYKPPHYAVRLGYFTDRLEARRVLSSIQGAARDVLLIEIPLPSRMSAQKPRGSGVVAEASADTSPLMSDPGRGNATSESSLSVDDSGLVVSPDDHAPVAGGDDRPLFGNTSESRTATQGAQKGRKADQPAVDQAPRSLSSSADNLFPAVKVERENADASSSAGRSPLSASPVEPDNLPWDPSGEEANQPGLPGNYFDSKHHVSLFLGGTLILLLVAVIGYVIRLRRGVRRIRTTAEKSVDPVDEKQRMHRPITSTRGAAEEPSVFSVDSAKPRLSPSFEKRVFKNIRQLAMVEANLLGVNKNLQVLYVSSCFSGEGKTTAALELAHGLAVQGGRNVLLIDWSDGKVSLTDYFSPMEQKKDPVSHGVEDFTVRVQTAYSGLDIMTLSRDAKNCARLRKDEVTTRIALLRKEYDYIIADGQPVFGSCFTMYADIFDGVILVVEAEKTKWEVVQFAIDKLQSLGGRVVGTILNKRKFYLPKFLYGKI